MRYVESADAALRAQRRDARAAGAGVIENRVDHRLLRPPRMKAVEVQALCQLSDQPVDRSCFTWWIERRLHQVEMRVRHLASQLLEPRGSRQHDVRKAASRLVEK